MLLLILANKYMYESLISERLWAEFCPAYAPPLHIYLGVILLGHMEAVAFTF